MVIEIADYIQVQQEMSMKGYPVIKVALTEEQAEKLAEQIMERLK